MAFAKPTPKPKPFSGDKSFANINAYLSNFDKTGASASEFKPLEVSEWIHSGNYLLNAMLSGSLLKGYACNRMYTVAGDPKTGKTFLLKNAIRNVQKAGYFPIIIESENAYTKDMLISHGIDPDGCRVTQMETPNDVTVFMAQMTEGLKATKAAKGEVPKFAIVIDSLNGLMSDKVMRDALAGEIKVDMGNQARELKLMFNFASTRLSKYDIPLFCAAHIYEATNERTHMRDRVVSGGMGSLYFSSGLLGLTKRSDYDTEAKERTGIIVRAEMLESRFSKSGTKIELFLRFKTGMNEFIGLLPFVSMATCGIGRGKFVEYFDLAGIILKKKMVTKETILEHFMSCGEFEGITAKDKHEYLYQNIQKAIQRGYVYIVGGGTEPNKSTIIGFTSKIMEQFTPDGEYKPVTFNYGFAKETSPDWVVEHLGKTLPTEKLFVKEVFTRTVLEKIEPIARATFELNGPSVETSYEHMEEEEMDSAIDMLLAMAPDKTKDILE